MSAPVDNPNPQVRDVGERVAKTFSPSVVNKEAVFEYIRDIQDPEHPLTLEQLNVVDEECIEVDLERRRVGVEFTPTVPHCSMSTLIGLSIRTQLNRSLPPKYKCSVRIAPGTHNTEAAINKQLADKERVAAALENPYLLDVVNRCIQPPE